MVAFFVEEEEEEEEQPKSGGKQAGKFFVVAPPNGPTVTDTPEDEEENPVGNVSILRNHRLPSLGWPRFVNVAVVVDVEGIKFCTKTFSTNWRGGLFGVILVLAI